MSGALTALRRLIRSVAGAACSGAGLFLLALTVPITLAVASRSGIADAIVWSSFLYLFLLAPIAWQIWKYGGRRY